MSSVLTFEFPHRSNDDGTIDSVCPRCYATVATSTWEAELELAEREHICESTRLRVFGMTHKPPFRQTWIPSRELDKTAWPSYRKQVPRQPVNGLMLGS